SEVSLILRARRLIRRRVHPHSLAVLMVEPILEFRAVSKTFGGIRALRDVSFAIPRGEIHALVGENGAGKSTLIRICGGLFTPDSGTVLYEGRELRIDGAHASREAGIGIVHQEIPICSDLTAA